MQKTSTGILAFSASSIGRAQSVLPNGSLDVIRTTSSSRCAGLMGSLVIVSWNARITYCGSVLAMTKDIAAAYPPAGGGRVVLGAEGEVSVLDERTLKAGLVAFVHLSKEILRTHRKVGNTQGPGEALRRAGRGVLEKLIGLARVLPPHPLCPAMKRT